MLSAEKPLLTDVYIEISDGVSDVELYPFPIPDLFSGRPLVVSGRFNGTWPGTVRVGGYLPDGRQWSKEVPTFMEAAIPLSRVFAKQRIDLMAAKVPSAPTQPPPASRRICYEAPSNIAVTSDTTCIRGQLGASLTWCFGA